MLRQFAFRLHPDHAERRTAQGIGVAGASGLLANRPEARERVELVGQRHGEAHRPGGQAIGGPLRFVVVADRVGDVLVFAHPKRMIPPHHPLKLGELADHFGHEVHLRQHCRAVGKLRVRTHLRGERFGKRRHALDLVPDAAEFFVKHQRVELFDPLRRIKGQLAVKVPEVARVAQPRRQHPGVAGRDLGPAIARLEVGDGDEMRREVAGGRVTHGEILLVRAHAEPDDLRRQIEKARLHVAKNGDRVFDQPCNFVREPLVFHKLEVAGLTQGAGVGKQACLALIPVEDDVPARAKRRLIVLKTAHRERPAPHHPMPLGEGATVKAIDLKRHELAVKRAQNALYGPHPAGVPADAQRVWAPAHRLRPGESADRARDSRGDHLHRLPTRAQDVGDVEAALLGVLHHPRLVEGGDTGGFQEALYRALGAADAGALALLAHVRRAHRQTIGHQHQPPGAREAAHRLRQHARGSKRVHDEPLQVGLGTGLHPGGDFFGEDFEQQLGHGALIPAPEQAARGASAAR